MIVDAVAEGLLAMDAEVNVRGSPSEQKVANYADFASSQLSEQRFAHRGVRAGTILRRVREDLEGDRPAMSLNDALSALGERIKRDREDQDLTSAVASLIELTTIHWGQGRLGRRRLRCAKRESPRSNSAILGAI